MRITGKKRQVNKRVLFVILLIIVILVVAFGVLIYKNKMARIETFSFSETQDINLTFTDIEKENINSVLQSLYVEDNNYFGFSSHPNESIDIKSTAFGVMLAQKTDFPLNQEKLKKYIEDNYSNHVLIENTYDRTSALYYNLILDQLVNGYEQDYNTAYFQLQIDEILKELEYDQSIAADLVSARRIVELVSDLKIFEAEVKLTIAQKNKIKKGLKRALENSTLANSVLLNDIFIVDKILNLGIVSNEKLTDVYVSLTINGGTCAASDPELIPDIGSTYQFMSSFNRVNLNVYLEQQKSFVETQKSDEGVYVSGNNSFDLSVITYGNAIRCLELGGDKDD